MLRKLILLAFLATCASTVFGDELSFNARTVTASKLTPGADSLLLGFGYEPSRYIARSFRYERVLSDEDRDGVVTLELEFVQDGSALAKAAPHFVKYNILEHFHAEPDQRGGFVRLL